MLGAKIASKSVFETVLKQDHVWMRQKVDKKFKKKYPWIKYFLEMRWPGGMRGTAREGIMRRGQLFAEVGGRLIGRMVVKIRHASTSQARGGGFL